MLGYIFCLIQIKRYQVFDTYLFCENTYPLHTQFAPLNIPFTYLWAPKIHTFLSIKYIGAFFLAQPNEYATVKENRMTKLIRLGEGVQLFRGKSFVLRHSKTFWASLPFRIAGKHSCEGRFTYLFCQIHTFYIPNFWKRYVYIPRYANTYQSEPKSNYWSWMYIQLLDAGTSNSWMHQSLQPYSQQQ